MSYNPPVSTPSSPPAGATLGVVAYDEDLANLKTMLAQMGGLAEDHLAKAIEALSKRDTKLADVVIAQDEKIDALELQLEERAILTIAKRQPMARDLREIMVAIRIASGHSVKYVGFKPPGSPGTKGAAVARSDLVTPL